MRDRSKMSRTTRSKIALSQCFSLILCMLLLQSCQRHQALPNALENYSERMYKVLDLEQKNISTFATLEFPDKNAFVIDIPDLNIKMREFYAIDGCAIKQLVAERNTALGKIQLPSVRLSYEWVLIERLQQCINSNVNKQTDATIEKMQNWVLQKQAILPLNWANMMTQSNEFYLGISASSGFIEGNENDNFTDGLFDLKNLIAIKDDPSANIMEMEASLQSIAKHRIYARLWRSQLLLRNYLDEMTTDISQWALTFTCKTNQDKEKLAIVRNVFTLFFIQNVQAIGAQVNHYHYLLKPEFLKLSIDDHLPNNFTLIIEQHNQLQFDKYQQAMLTHIEMWQGIFKKCD
jgi:hypothetical protein